MKAMNTTFLRQARFFSLLALLLVAFLQVGCDSYHYHGDCRLGKECKGDDCDWGSGFFPRKPSTTKPSDDGKQRDKNDNNDKDDQKDPPNTTKPSGDAGKDKLQCLQSCYDQGKGKDECQAACNKPSGAGDGTKPGDGGSDKPGDGGSSKPEIDQPTFDKCWASCKAEGEVSCVCESRCRSQARGVWVSKCWETCAKSQQDLAVCKKKCDA